MASATFPGNGNYRLDLATWVDSGTRLNASISVTKTAGSGYWTYDAQPWSMNIAGNGFGGSWTYDFRASTPQTIGITTQSAWVGYGWNVVSASVQMDGFGTASTSEGRTVSGPPNAPNTPSASSITPASMTLSWNIPADNGAGIDQMLLRRYNDAGLTTYTDYPLGGGVTSANVTLLNPGTTYWWAVYAHNANGYSARSGVLQQATLPSGPPSFTVTPSASGTQAALAFTPPSGASGVTKYTFERRPLPAASPTTSADSATNSATVTGLTPGVQYEWRASAWFGTYQSPWTAWTTVQQPNPNVNPGDFFDGNSTDLTDVDYGWAGTANLSTSRGVGRGVDGWAAILSGSATGVVQQVTGGYAGQFAARLVFKTDASAAGQGLGMANAAGKRAEVVSGAAYVGSIYARPSKAKNLLARLIYLDAAGVAIPGATYSGPTAACAAGAWSRLTASGDAPADVEFAIVVVVDAATGALWLSGDYLDADAAMVTLGSFPYFDGSTPDTAQFQYDWLGPEHASPSRRTAIPEQPFVVQDPDCAIVPSAPRPPQITNDCIVTIGEWRRYAFAIPSVEVSRWLEIVPTVYISTLGAAATQVRVRFYRNPEAEPIASYDNWDGWESELYLSYMPANSLVTLDGITQEARGDLQGRTNVPMNHLLYGSLGGVVTWPSLTCGDAYIMTVDTPLDLPAGGLSVEVDLRQRGL